MQCGNCRYWYPVGDLDVGKCSMNFEELVMYFGYCDNWGMLED